MCDRLKMGRRVENVDNVEKMQKIEKNQKKQLTFDAPHAIITELTSLRRPQAHAGVVQW
mgnify:CR=1 FL=1